MIKKIYYRKIVVVRKGEIEFYITSVRLKRYDKSQEYEIIILK